MISGLLKNLEKLQLSPLIKAYLLHAGSRVAVHLNDKSMNTAKEYVKQAYEIFSAIFHPDSVSLEEIKSFVLDVEEQQEGKVAGQGRRHCGYCTKRISSDVILCEKCQRRAYCSEKCQKYDWTSKRGLETCRFTFRTL